MRSRSELTTPAGQTPPPLGGRIHYLIGGLLPPSCREWVAKDLTGPGWRHRQAGRLVLLMLPFAIAFAILPGTASVRASIPLGLLLIAVVMGYTTGDYFRNRRLDQYGMERPKPVEEDAYLDYEPPQAEHPAVEQPLASHPEHDPEDE